MLHALLPLNKGALLLTSLLLFVINIRWLSAGGMEGNSSRGNLLARRLKTPALACLLVVTYFLTGAMVNLVLIQRTDSERRMSIDEESRRPYKDSIRIGLNTQYRDRLGVYGPIPLPSLLGQGVASFLRGLGVGLDPTAADYQAERRRALERAILPAGINVCRDNARLELAALEALPAPFENPWDYPTKAAIPEEEPGWITIGLVDAERWWVSRKPTGPDPERAERLCREILEGKPPSAIAAEALDLQARLAEQRWDFPTAASCLQKLVEAYPETALAAEKVPQIARRMERNGQQREAIALCQSVLLRQPPERGGWLAEFLASMQIQSNDKEGARLTLQKALAELERDTITDNDPQSEGNALRHTLEDALKNLDKAAAATHRRSPPIETGLHFSAHARLLAEGKPLSGVMAALVPLRLAGQALPPDSPPGWDASRPPGSFPAAVPHRSQMYGAEAWNTDRMALQLRTPENFIACSDSQGVLRWSALPAGTYAVFLRMGTWQLKEGGRNLAPVPLPAPITIAGPETTLPDLRLVAPIHLTLIQGETGIPALRWEAVPGAAAYQVALRIDNAGQRTPMLATEAGNGAPEIDPDLVWWREGITATSITLSPERFVGPAAESRSNGMHWGVRYNWCVEARDASGHLLKTSEMLAAPMTLTAQEWTALLPRKASGQSPPKISSSGLMASQAMFPKGPAQYSSPFLLSLQADRERENRPISQSRRPLALATVASEGQGLPPLRPLAASPSPGGRGE